MDTICIIPARGGSTRIPGKNIKEFHGKPIIWYSFERAIDSGLFNRIIVSTDSVEVAAVARKYGIEVWNRDSAYGEDNVGTQEVVAECLKGIGASPYDTVCCLYATAPLLDIRDLMAGHAVLTSWARDYVDYVFSVGYPPLQDVGQFYWGMAASFMNGLPLVSGRTRMVHVQENRVCDINTLEDWERALVMYEALK